MRTIELNYFQTHHGIEWIAIDNMSKAEDMDLADYMVTSYEILRAAALHPPKDIRLGQHAFNLLCDLRPDISEQVRGRFNTDPFYRDDYLDAFWSFVEDHWLV